MIDYLLSYLELILSVAAVAGVLFSVIKWVFDTNNNIKKLLEELTLNHGTSLKDKINTIENSINKHIEITQYTYSMQKWLLSLSDKMIFKTDENGNWTWINDSLKCFLNINEKYLINNGWQNFINHDDRKDAIKLWNESFINKKNACIICNFRINNITNKSSSMDKYIKVNIITERLYDGTYAGWLKTE